MSARLDVTGAAVLPFQFPSLDEDAAAVPAAVGSPPGVTAEGDPAAPALNGADAHATEIAAAVSEARSEGLLRGLEEGREKGYAAGVAEGIAAGEATVAEAARRLEAIVARLGVPLAALEQPVEEAVAALALELARCVIGGEVKRSREFLVRLVREAIAKVPLEMGEPRVLLNPDDLELVRRLAPEIDNASATLVADDAIEAGGCLVVADGEGQPVKDRRWNPRNPDGASQVNLTLASRWREVMLTLFDGEDE